MTDSVTTRIELPGQVISGGAHPLSEGSDSDEGRETYERQMAAVDAVESVSIQDLARIRIR